MECRPKANPAEVVYCMSPGLGGSGLRGQAYLSPGPLGARGQKKPWHKHEIKTRDATTTTNPVVDDDVAEEEDADLPEA